MRAASESPVRSPRRPGLRRRPGALFIFDPGWLYLLAGMALLAATVLIPASDDLAHAEGVRDQALALEQHRTRRLANYASYLDALKSQDPTLIESLAAQQLNLAPTAYRPLPLSPDESLRNVSPFPALEPEFIPAPVRPVVITKLRQLTTNDLTRLWMLAIGSMCVLLGLLPESQRTTTTGSLRRWRRRLWPKWLVPTFGKRRPAAG